MPPSSWSSIKPRLQYLSKDDLLRLLHDLYALNADNKAFLATRFAPIATEDLAAPYRKMIRASSNPKRDLPSFQIHP